MGLHSRITLISICDRHECRRQVHFLYPNEGGIIDEQRKFHKEHERENDKESGYRMAEKEEVRYYSENKIKVNGKVYNVTFTFPLPENETETAYDKLKHLINGEKVS